MASNENYATYCNIKNIENRMNGVNSNFSFKIVDQDQVFKEIKKLDWNKASLKNDILIKTIKENIDIISYILYHNFRNSSFYSELPGKLK